MRGRRRGRAPANFAQETPGKEGRFKVFQAKLGVRRLSLPPHVTNHAPPLPLCMGAAIPRSDDDFEVYLNGHAVIPSNSPKYILYSIGGELTKGIFGLTPSLNFEHVADLTEVLDYHTSLNLARNEIPGCI